MFYIETIFLLIKSRWIISDEILSLNIFQIVKKADLQRKVKILTISTQNYVVINIESSVVDVILFNV